MKHTIAFYNVENLFDIYNDPDTDDDAFTPFGPQKWTQERYERKIKGIAKVIEHIGDGELPILVGLAEVENADVLKDLTESSALQQGSYNVAHVDSMDERGMDVGLLYRKDYFTFKRMESLSVRFPFHLSDETRGILHVEGLLFHKIKLHIFVNHWPSRREGTVESEPKRLEAAGRLSEKIEDIVAFDPEARILIMGDFNDYPIDASLSKVLRARSLENMSNDGLYNLLLAKHLVKEGSHNHRGYWGMFDQFIASKSLIHGPDALINPEEVFVLRADWLLFKHPVHGDMKPHKTFSGPVYRGGYSDHLPIYLKIGPKSYLDD